ncbi:hypothetical protein [Duganella sacchari]|nr:hypothetical protein [Duganella sacchari]
MAARVYGEWRKTRAVHSSPSMCAEPLASKLLAMVRAILKG